MKYFMIWICSFYIINMLWQEWEKLVYGELQPDTFDGAVLILLVSALTTIAMLLDIIKEMS